MALCSVGGEESSCELINLFVVEGGMRVTMDRGCLLRRYHYRSIRTVYCKEEFTAQKQEIMPKRA